MPFTGSAGDKNFSRTNGTWSGPTTWQQTEAGGHDILSLDEDIHDQDMALAIDNSLQRNGDNKAIADIPMNGYGFTGMGTGDTNGDSIEFSQLMQSIPFYMAGGMIVASAAANILTVALKRLDGQDPTVARPIFLQFHSYNSASGTPQVIKVTSALSLTISAGSTLGATPNVPIKLYVMAIADGTVDGSATPRLGIINAPQMTSNLGNYTQFVNTTAEGGAGAADSANVIYAAAAVTFKPYRTIGYLYWPGGVPVAGNWTPPSYVVTQAQPEPVPVAAAVPVGAVMPFASGNIPMGWLMCNGQAINRTTYANLYSVIANLYGAGDGSTTFNVPDLMGRVVAHYDPGAGRLTAAGIPFAMNTPALGGVGGRQYHISSQVELPAHTHYMDHTHITSGGGNFRTTAAGPTSVATPIAGTTNGDDPTTGGASTVYTGNPPTFGDAHNNLQPTIVLYYIIYAGV